MSKAYFKGVIKIMIKVIHDWCFFPHMFNNAKKTEILKLYVVSKHYFWGI